LQLLAKNNGARQNKHRLNTPAVYIFWDSMQEQASSDVPQQPPLRWYDARARVACMRLSHWLRVPLATFIALEAALLQGGAQEGANEMSKEQLHSYHNSSGTNQLAAARGLLVRVMSSLRE
jgi:hypothetical protein